MHDLVNFVGGDSGLNSSSADLENFAPELGKVEKGGLMEGKRHAPC